MKQKEEETTYTLRGIPVGIWQAFKVKCAQEGTPMRTKLIELIAKYNEGKIK